MYLFRMLECVYLGFGALILSSFEKSKVWASALRELNLESDLMTLFSGGIQFKIPWVRLNEGTMLFIRLAINQNFHFLLFYVPKSSLQSCKLNVNTNKLYKLLK